MTEQLSRRKLAEAAHLFTVHKDRYRSGVEIEDLVRDLEASGIKIAGDDPWGTLRSALNGDQTQWVNGGEGRWIAVDEVRAVGTESPGRALPDVIYPLVQVTYTTDRVFRYERAKEAMLRTEIRIKGPVTGRTMRSALLGSADRFETVPGRGRGMWQWKWTR